MQMNNITFLDWVTPDRGGNFMGRGVTSFAAEPTFFGIILFFLVWLIFNSVRKIKPDDIKQNYLRKSGYITMFMNLIAIFFISKSATVILLVFVFIIFIK